MTDKLKKIIKSIDDARVKDIKIYQTNEITPFFDYAIVATASSSRQMNGVVSHLQQEAVNGSYHVKNVEGQNGGYWLLVDLEDVIVNVFCEEAREKYDLDRLWCGLKQLNCKDFL